MPMNPVVKGQWLAALRSDEYQQGQGYLTQPDENDPGKETDCCLGVLCKLAVKAGVDITVDQRCSYTLYNGNSGALPPVVCDWAGLEHGDPSVPLDGYIELTGSLAADCDQQDSVKLAALNDYDDDPDDRWTFGRIADVIEKYL